MKSFFKPLVAAAVLIAPLYVFAQQGAGPFHGGPDHFPGHLPPPGGPGFHHWDDHWGVADFQQRYEGLFEQNAQLQAQVTGLSSANVNLTAQLTGCQSHDAVDDQQVAADNNALSQANARITRQSALIGQLKTQVAQLQAQLPANTPVQPLPPSATAAQNVCTLTVTSATGTALTGVGKSWVSEDDANQTVAKKAAISNCQTLTQTVTGTADPACSDATARGFNISCSVVQAAAGQ